MSHVGNGENDFEGLDRYDDQKIARYIERVREEARDIIDRLEPLHISTWDELLSKLELSLELAEIEAEQQVPGILAKREQEKNQQQKEQKKKKIR